jgi:hypothetical protein
MSNKTGALVLTTIFDPTLLDDYYNNFKKYNHLDQVKVFVIPDKKTPSSAYNRCEQLRDKGLYIKCPSIQEQDEYLNKIGDIAKLIPYNSDNRRNFGFLMSLESGVDFMISIDDDNYCQMTEDFFAQHSVVCCDQGKQNEVYSSNGWFNIIDMLDIQPEYSVYPRGFPYHKKHQKVNLSYKEKDVLVRLNAGLWLFEPDLDAISWLVAPVKSKSFNGQSYALSNDTWSPINTQNTALHRDVIPSYYFIRMGYPLAGIPIDRYGDIFSGFFSQACIRHLGHGIRVGTPIVEHRRNSHNYLNDATNELACIWVLEDLLNWLPNVDLDGNNYFDAYTSLSYAIEDIVEKLSGFIWTYSTRGYFHHMAYSMRKWIQACRTVY